MSKTYKDREKWERKRRPARQKVRPEKDWKRFYLSDHNSED